MKVAIVFDSSTGRTKAAAEEMAQVVQAAGHECSVLSVHEADPAEVSAADALCIGSGVQGPVFVAQRPTTTTIEFIDQLDELGGKPAAVFCTYKTAVGRMLKTMAARLEGRGANVTGSFKSRGPFAAEGFKSWAESLG